MVELLKKRYLTNAIARSYTKYSKTKPIILIDLGATNCRATIRSLRGEKILRGILKSKYQTKVKSSKKAVIESIMKVTERYLEVYPESEVRMAVCGVVKDKVTLPNLNIAEWDMKKDLYKLFGHTNIKIINDVVAAYYGEDAEDSTVIYVGTGIGSSEKGENLEIGRSYTYPDYKYKGYGNRKSNVENYASGLALKKQCELQGLEIDADIHEIGKILSDMSCKDAKAREVLAQTGKILGQLINNYNEHKKHPSNWKYIIGGSLGKNKYYFEGIKSVCNLNVEKSKYEGSEAIYKGLISKFN